MKIIAYYLPQYYPFKENNKWWGEGFTEWTNVGKAKKLFKNHYQPKIPADLGYYDLRVPQVREKQAELARQAGIHGFCYWHYWFGNGKQLLDLPMKEILNTKKPNFPFCLGWANESWKAKVWNLNDTSNDKMLIEQLYPGEEDIINHFYSILPALKDKRYITIENKPVFVVYKPFLLKDAKKFIEIWNKLISKEKLSEGFFFIGHTVNIKEKDEILNLGFNCVNIVRNGEYRFNKEVIKKISFQLFKFKILKKPLKLKYSFISRYFIQDIDKSEEIIPTIIPNWDHTPRSGNKGVVFHESKPLFFRKHVQKALDVTKHKKRKVLFLKSWNEWGEGNYMEPDLKFGKKYIEILGEEVKEI
ncbi:glycoside hydrolase family 99-like domain-containing protein [Polaribacter dokdonensis]|uniref:Glycosyltransferase WbsX n=1 Tax=Polaribacter dokdonensis DSW-5 TaxID=1300348 RepID=A0A0M9CEP9_9FLAO|nr:glycoside hydrolase family 99-like domain-containing protein [Polaribacter dokdonensis]KOY50659.1 Glycosyltransferase WbsX [Polaribacter dokdonensis DSW-5]SEE62357.1 Glycosyltransferase WbsX [Polaribacter dokdonensis DSW-5]